MADQAAIVDDREHQEHSEHGDTSQGESTQQTWSPDQIEAIRKEARDSAFAEARRSFENKPRKPKQQEPKTKQQQTDIDPGQWRDDFYDATAGLNLTKDQIKILRDSFRRAMPEDPDVFVAQFVAAFGIGDNTEREPEQQTQQETQVSKGPTKSDGGSPSSSPVWEQPTNPLTWSADDVARIKALKGDREGSKFIRDRFNAHMRGTVMKLGDPGKR